MYHNHRHCRHDHGDSGMGCLVMVLLGLFALPFVGLYLVSRGNEDDKVLGTILMIVGTIIWIMIAAQS